MVALLTTRPTAQKRALSLPLWVLADAVVHISGVVILAALVGAFALKPLAESFFGLHDLVPLPTIHLMADALFELGPVLVTNTLLTSLLVVLLFALAIHCPWRPLWWLRLSVEFLFETSLGFVKGMVGENWSVLTFSFVTTIFVFVLANAWASVLPLFGPILLSAEDASGEAVPLLRGAGADVNMPLALALVAGRFVEMHAFLTRGVSYFKQLFPVRIFRRRIWEGILDVYLVVIHDLTRAARLLSFTFRLFGALTAAEPLRVMIAFLTPILLVVPLYGLEILLGLLQAIVFAGLTLVSWWLQRALTVRPTTPRRSHD